MKIFDQYIGKVVLVGILMSLLVLLAIDTFFAFVGEVGDIGEGDYGVMEATLYIALTIPRRIYDLFPVSALLGSLLGLGTLAGTSELVALRTAGVSISRIFLSIMRVGMVLLVLVVLLGEFVVPKAEGYAKSRREIAKTENITFKGRQGFWARDGQQYINIERILPGGRLHGIFVYAFDDERKLVSATQAESAMFHDQQWILENVHQSRLDENRVETRFHERVTVDSLLNPQILNAVVIEPENLAIRDLLGYIDYLEQNGLDAERYRLALWMKVAAPVGIVVMFFLAVPFVFGPLRSVGSGQRVLIGILVGVLFYLFNQTVGYMGQVYGFNPIGSVFAPILLFLSIGLIMLRRTP